MQWPSEKGRPSTTHTTNEQQRFSSANLTKTEDELRFFGKVRSFCSIGNTPRFTDN